MSFNTLKYLLQDNFLKKPNNVSDQEYKAWICSKALQDWGVCMMGKQLPAKFGEGMTRVNQLLNVSADPTSLKNYADEFLKGTVSEL